MPKTLKETTIIQIENKLNDVLKNSLNSYQIIDDPLILYVIRKNEDHDVIQSLFGNILDL